MALMYEHNDVLSNERVVVVTPDLHPQIGPSRGIRGDSIYGD